MVYRSRFRADCICIGDGGRPPYLVGVSITTSSDIYHFAGISRSVPASRFLKRYVSRQSCKESPENISYVAEYERGGGGLVQEHFYKLGSAILYIPPYAQMYPCRRSFYFVL
jgi:hypothetical protein